MMSKSLSLIAVKRLIDQDAPLLAITEMHLLRIIYFDTHTGDFLLSNRSMILSVHSCSSIILVDCFKLSSCCIAYYSIGNVTCQSPLVNDSQVRKLPKTL